MNKHFIVRLLLAVMMLPGIFRLAAAQGEEGQAGAVIDLIGSDIYTQEEMEEALDLVLEEFSKWDGCTLHRVSYGGDGFSKDELELTNRMFGTDFDGCLLFFTAFRSPKEQTGAWEADREYFYSWTVCRKGDSPWELVNWGWHENFLKSEQYSEEDMTAAEDLLTAAIGKMEGVQLHFIFYTGDKFSNAELNYINSLQKGEFDECAVFHVTFQSPRTAYGSWEADRLYVWTFYLGRADKGEWNLITYGY